MLISVKMALPISIFFTKWCVTDSEAITKTKTKTKTKQNKKRKKIFTRFNTGDAKNEIMCQSGPPYAHKCLKDAAVNINWITEKRLKKRRKKKVFKYFKQVNIKTSHNAKEKKRRRWKEKKNNLALRIRNNG